MYYSKDVNGNDLDCKLWIDKRIGNYLSYLQHHIIDNDYDYVSLIFGDEGTGKSVFGMTMCYYLDSNFNEDNIVFTPEQFKIAVSQLPPGSAILWDESEEIGGHHFGKIIQTLKSFMQKMRQQNKKVFLVKPAMKDINWYFINRSRWGAWEMYDKPYKTSGADKRGYGYFYNLEQLKRYKDDPKGFDFDKEGLEFRTANMVNVPGFPIDMSPGGRYDKKKKESYAASASLQDTQSQVLVSLAAFVKDNKDLAGAYRFGKEELELNDFTAKTFRRHVNDYLEEMLG